ncbi:MAG: hypothetical protein MZW92_31355 [Comamonadaceae bacterium]|nr:hypothetical protein [Comamonadaceae bacterium]
MINTFRACLATAMIPGTETSQKTCFCVPTEFRKQAKDNKQASEGKLSGAEEVTAWLAYKRVCEECFKACDTSSSI